MSALTGLLSQQKVRFQRDSIHGLRGAACAAIVDKRIPRSRLYFPTERGSKTTQQLMEMTDRLNKWEVDTQTDDAWAVDERQPQGIQFTLRSRHNLTADSRALYSRKPLMIGWT
jgi:hypothetical protein